MDMNEALKSCPPEGQERHQAYAAVKTAIASACGTGIPLERSAEAAFDAALIALAEVIGEHDALEMVQRWLDEYEQIVGEGTFGPVLRDPPAA